MKIEISDFLPIVKQCGNCQKINPDTTPWFSPIEVPLPEVPTAEVTLEIPEVRRCLAYINPVAKWENGKICPLATHVERKVEEEKKHIDPIKLSKQLAKGRAKK